MEAGSAEDRDQEAGKPTSRATIRERTGLLRSIETKRPAPFNGLGAGSRSRNLGREAKGGSRTDPGSWMREVRVSSWAPPPGSSLPSETVPLSGQ